MLSLFSKLVSDSSIISESRKFKNRYAGMEGVPLDKSISDCARMKVQATLKEAVEYLEFARKGFCIS